MPAPQAVSSLYGAQQRRIAATIVAARSEWDSLQNPAQFGRVISRLAALISAAQLGAARDGSAMVPAALGQTGFPEKPLALVNPKAFMNVASDGRSLESLLWLVPDVADRAGGPVVQRMAAGRTFLDLVTHRQVADAGRGASSVAIAATARTGWVRYVNPPCCQRCAVLAGRVYRYSQGFKRHHRCDCQMRPVSDREPPEGYTDTIKPDQIHDLTDAQREALAEGADLNRTVNAYRKRLKDRDKMTTTYELARGGGRLTPDGIYQVASSREQAIAMLRTHGYLL